MSSDEPAAENGGKPGRLAFDTSKAHQARMYDYLLGGKDNYAADRAAVEAGRKIWPEGEFTARANRAFLGRLVRYLAGEAGIRQFLDLGTGIPTAGNTHQVAQAIAPESRVVYVDYDPVVLAHARALLDSSDEGATEYIDADLRDTGKILTRAAELLDFTRPVAVTLIAILHAIPDADDPHAIVAKIMDAVPPGSYIAISHIASDLIAPETLQEMKDLASRVSQQQFWYRTREQVAGFFEGTELVEPGLVRVEEWRPEPGTREARRSSLWCAVGRKVLCITAAAKRLDFVCQFWDLIPDFVKRSALPGRARGAALTPTSSKGATHSPWRTGRPPTPASRSSAETARVARRGLDADGHRFLPFAATAWLAASGE